MNQHACFQEGKKILHTTVNLTSSAIIFDKNGTFRIQN